MTCCNRNCRQGRDCEERRPSILATRGFWIGALASVAIWMVVIGIAVLVYLRWTA